MPAFPDGQAIDFVKKDPGSPGVERCISASMREIEHTEKQSSDENDTQSVIITESETIGASLCDGIFTDSYLMQY